MLLAGAAGSATLDYEGTVTVTFTGSPPIVITGTGVATVNGTGGLGALETLRLSNNASFSGTSTIVNPSTALIRSIRVTAGLGTGTLRPISGGGPLTAGNNQLPIPGSARLAILTAGCGKFCVTVPLTQSGNGVGLGGTLTTPSLSVNLVGGRWTVGSAKATGSTTGYATFTTKTTGFAHGPNSGSSTAKIGGVVQVVTPTVVSTGVSADTPILTSLRIRFVPEPVQLLLLGTGVAGLAGIARAERRRGSVSRPRHRPRR